MTQKILQEYYFLFFTILIALFLAFKMISFPANGTLEVTVLQNRKALSHLDVERDIQAKKKIRVDTIDFLQGRLLEHPQIGKLGNSSNFFMDINTEMQVNKKGEYHFLIYSDDGFRLKLNGDPVCEFPGNRPMQLTSCKMQLDKKIYTFNLSYFQGGGPMGLKAYYQRSGEKRHIIGKNTDLITFKAIDG
jgi:hypothetical protein